MWSKSMEALQIQKICDKNNYDRFYIIRVKPLFNEFDGSFEYNLLNKNVGKNVYYFH
jgi:hypothetical protein